MLVLFVDPKVLFGMGDKTDSRVRSIMGLRIPLLICYFKKPGCEIIADCSDSDSVRKEFRDSS